MSYFETRLLCENLDMTDDQLYIVYRDLVYHSDLIGKVVVPAGFKTDKATVPRVPFLFDYCGDTSDFASVVHDYLYAAHICSRPTADAVLREASLITQVGKFRSFVMWLGVRSFGQKYWDRGGVIRLEPL